MSTPKSSTPGITWVASRGKWRAKMTHDGQHRNVGIFSDLAEAERAMARARRGLPPKADKAPAAIESIPDEVLAELSFLNFESSQVRGFTPLDHPRRQAGTDFCVLALSTIEKYGVSLNALSRVLGVSDANVRLKLGRHGYLPNPPSQKTYKGVPAAGGRKRQSECKQGHDTSFEGSRYASGGCKECLKNRGTES
jgi:hypothetical protein